MKQLIVAISIIILLVIIVFQLGYIVSRLDYIDWNTRNILGKFDQ